MKRLLPLFLTIVPFSTFVLAAASPAQDTGLLKQIDQRSAPVPLPDSDRAELSDPLFQLVFKDHPNVKSLADIENFLQPDATKRVVFVVDEDIADARRGQSRRSVLAFKGSNNGLRLDGNVMLSVFFSDDSFPDALPEIEAWGWDEVRGQYNYYKFDGAGGSLSWKFRGSSKGASALSQQDRQPTCFACHVNGGPVMKELLFPWNNWHSLASQAAYLSPTAASAVRWPVANSNRLQGHLDGAENLEGMLISGITRFNRTRVARHLPLGIDKATGKILTDTLGAARVVDAKGLLRPLFQTTEFNLISATEKSGLHKVDVADAQGPMQGVTVPASALLNVNLIAGGGIPRFTGLGIAEASSFTVKMSGAEYKSLITTTKTKMNGKLGDSDFAWFVPEPSHIDNGAVEQCLQIGIISPKFAAAVLAMDLEHPVLSADRAALANFLPSEFNVRPSGGADELTNLVVANVEATHPVPGSVAARFLNRLKDPDPVARLREDVVAYQTRVQTALNSPTTRPSELLRLYQETMETRRRVLADTTLRRLDETGRNVNLMPLADK